MNQTPYTPTATPNKPSPSITNSTNYCFLSGNINLFPAISDGNFTNTCIIDIGAFVNMVVGEVIHVINTS